MDNSTVEGRITVMLASAVYASHVALSTYIVLYCIVLYCIMRPYTDGPIGPLSYRHSSGVVRNPHSTLAE